MERSRGRTMNKGIKVVCRIGFYVVVVWLAVACVHVLLMPADMRVERAESLIVPPAIGLVIFGGFNVLMRYRFHSRPIKPSEPRHDISSEERIDHRRWGGVFILCAVGQIAISVWLLYLFGWVFSWESTEALIRTAAIYIMWMIGFTLLVWLQGRAMKKMKTSDHTDQQLILKLQTFSKKDLDEGEAQVAYDSAYRTHSFMKWVFFIAILISLYFGQLFAFFILAAIWIVHLGYFYYTAHKRTIY